MKNDLTAKASVKINAPIAKVWEGLTNPTLIKKYMMGATVACDWGKGSKITWSGEFKGKKYEDKGEILDIEAEKKLQYSHFSPMSGEEDVPENYHTVTIDLLAEDGQTTVTLLQDKNKTEEAKEESEKNWKSMLDGLKKVVEEKE
ncbi:MAG TPA: SRPBCC domain-containing protein [Bacteroidia bacterium]|nr:SRPBCC domain-containing protein [Bacteroidia bacterium]